MTSYCRRPLNFGAHERPTVGDVKISFTSFDHLGWIKCDGSLISKTDYALLYNVIGDKYGSGNGTQFRLPDAQGRVTGIVGTPSGAVGTAHAIGSVTGTETHTLTIAEMPAHKHGSVDVSGNSNGDGNTSAAGSAAESENVGGGSAANVAGSGSHNHTIGSTGGGAAHNNMQPTLFVGNMFIYTGKTQYGYFPYAIGPNATGPNLF
jgi:microcystin-dependent protein